MLGRLRRSARHGDLARVCATPTRLARGYAASSSVEAAAKDRTSAQQPDEPAKPVGFDRIVPGVLQFYKIYNHFAVPVGFRVPVNRSSASSARRSSLSNLSWPNEFEGFPLGFKLKALLSNPKHREANQEVIDELRTIKFPVDVNWRAYLWKHSTLRALEAYKEIHGDLIVPRNFIVPSDDPAWPIETRGLCLGLKVMNFRQQRYDILPSEVEDLERIGFVWDVHDYVWTNRLLPALEAHKKVYGHCLVERNFVVPSEEPWPRETWNLALGNAVSALRSPNPRYELQVKRDRDHLEELGFVWDVRHDRWSSVVLPALETYAKLNGRFRRISQSFVVPAEDPWPKETWGFRLGHCVYNIRTLATFRSQVLRNAQHLDRLGWLRPLAQDWVRPEFWPRDAKPSLIPPELARRP